MSSVSEGVLRMPPNLWSDDLIDVRQRHSTYIWAADRISQLEAENAALQEDSKIIDELCALHGCRKEFLTIWCKVAATAYNERVKK